MYGLLNGLIPSYRILKLGKTAYFGTVCTYYQVRYTKEYSIFATTERYAITRLPLLWEFRPVSSVAILYSPRLSLYVVWRNSIKESECTSLKRV